MSDLPSAPVKRLLIEGSQGLRVSGSALALANGQVAAFIRQLGAAAGSHATSDRRKTLKDEDISKAFAELTAGSGGAPSGDLGGGEAPV